MTPKLKVDSYLELSKITGPQGITSGSESEQEKAKEIKRHKNTLILY
jgi:hypothetical protein